MTDLWIWGVMASLLVLALGTSLKAVEAIHAKKLAEDECARLRVQLDALNQKKNEESVDYQPVSPAPDASGHQGLNADQKLLHSILASTTELHSQEIPATPRRVAEKLELDPEITLAHMWKYHNEQFITFRNDNKRPELDTAFFLSPKAWEQIKIVSK